jgi:deoxyxylulose-5-phosphate synthase
VYEACRKDDLKPLLLRHIGLPDRFIDHGSREELLHEVGLMPAQIAETIATILTEIPSTTAQTRPRSATEGWLD